jgi:hypothetical protein
MGDYWYEILGGFLIVLSSLVGEEMRTKWKIGFYVFFVVAAVLYAGFGIDDRRRAKVREAEDRREHKEEINALRGDMTKVLTSFNGVLPLITSKGVSDRLLVAMTPWAAQQLRERNDDWNSADGKEIIANADYLRQLMVRFLPQQTDEDRAMAEAFAKVIAGDFRNWKPVAAANYLEALRKRVIPATPTGLTATPY